MVDVRFELTTNDPPCPADDGICEGVSLLGYWQKVNQSPTQNKPYNIFALDRSFYSSTSSTTSVHADSSPERYKFCGKKTTIQAATLYQVDSRSITIKSFGNGKEQKSPLEMLIRSSGAVKVSPHKIRLRLFCHRAMLMLS